MSPTREPLSQWGEAPLIVRAAPSELNGLEHTLSLDKCRLTPTATLLGLVFVTVSAKKVKGEA